VHTPTKIVFACIILAASWIAATPSASQAPQPVTTVVQVTTSTTTTTTTTSAPPLDAACGRWWSLAGDVGFTLSEMPTLDRIIYRESRCDDTQHNPTDPNGGSYGLTQINGFWCQPSRYYPLGYLQTVGVLRDCVDLYDPMTNLRAAHALVTYSRSVGLCSWSQWAWLEDCG